MTATSGAPRPDFDAPFPALIPLPTVHGGGYATGRLLATEIATEDDLPGRFLVADLERGSLRRSAGGWDARYAHQHGSGRARLFWDATANRLGVEMSWRGREVSATWPGPRFADVMRACGTALATAWEDDIARLLGTHGARYVPRPQPPKGPLFYPDGALLAIVAPIAISRLVSVLGLHARLSRTGVCRAGVSAGCALIAREPTDGHGRPVTDAEAIAAIARSMGTPGVSSFAILETWMPVRCVWSYAYVAMVFLPDLEPFLDALAQSGIIAEARVARDADLDPRRDPMGGVACGALQSGAFIGGIVFHPQSGGPPHREVNLLDSPHVRAITAGGSCEDAIRLVSRVRAESRRRLDGAG